MDAAPALKRKGAEAPRPWVGVDGVAVPATKMRRLDAEVPPVEPGVGVPPQPFGVEGVRVSGDVAPPTAPVLKRRGAEAMEPWLLDGIAAPATKIRRLDAGVPPFEPGVGAPAPLVEPGAGVAPQPFGVEEVRMSGGAPPTTPVGVAPVANEERAIVVYQPAEAARNLLLGPLRPEAPLRVSPDWIHGLKSTVLQEASNHRALFEELAARDDNPNLAMVLWAPAQAVPSFTAAVAEMMDADQDRDGAAMEVDHDCSSQPAAPAGVAPQGEAFRHQQPQQHCVAPQQLQLPAASYQPSPVTWSWSTVRTRGGHCSD